MATLRQLGRGNQVVLSECDEVCECANSWPDNITSLLWLMLAGTCMWYAPRVLTNWLAVSLSNLSPCFVDDVLI